LAPVILLLSSGFTVRPLPHNRHIGESLLIQAAQTLPGLFRYGKLEIQAQGQLQIQLVLEHLTALQQ
jgi:hypothetical protein